MAPANKKRKINMQYRVKDVTNGLAPLRIKGKGNVKVRVPKKVKVSAKLKAKIMKVIDKKVRHVYGSYTDHYMGYQLTASNRCQNVIPILAGDSSFHFTTQGFLNAASVLFNDKGIPATAVGRYKQDVAGTMQPRNTIIDVNDAWSMYTFKNGTQHTIQFTICVCVPKRKGSCQEWNESKLGQTAGGADIAVEDALVSGYSSWVDALNTDAGFGLIMNGYMPDPVGSVDSVVTVRAPSVLDMWRRPDQCPTFRNSWKVEYINIVLQPGQQCSHKIQGPQKITIDYGKLYANDVLQNVQKYSRSVFGILINTPNALARINTSTGVGVLGTAGRWADRIDNTAAGFGVFVERTDHWSIKLPEQAGFTLTTNTIGATQTLNKRVSKQLTNNYFAAFGGTVLTPDTLEVIDLAVANPQAPVTNAPTGGG